LGNSRGQGLWYYVYWRAARASRRNVTTTAIPDTHF
jgi:hypothetical protein